MPLAKLTKAAWFIRYESGLRKVNGRVWLGGWFISGSKN
jgi:hypothetical protein